MKAKKSLGQNFLKSGPALRKIVEAGEIKEGDIILEIGPGKGALTTKLLETAGKVIAVEKDNYLFEFLKEKFAKEVSEERLVLLNEDILEFNVGKSVLEFFSGYPAPHRHHSKNSKHFSYKIIANIPYNITGAILKKFLTGEHQPDCMVLMVQHEVAKRIMASDHKESILSISVKAYGEPKLVLKVPARYFSPSPKVDSAVISIKNISRNNFTGQNSEFSEQKFWEIVKQGFAHKRKKLSGNLKGLLSLDVIGDFADKRAEDLRLEDWIFLAK